MEQLDQLRAMRDAARERVEAAIAAIQNGPDSKLAASLATLIADLEEQFGLAAPEPEAEAAPQTEEYIADFAAETEVTGATVTMDLAEAGAEEAAAAVSDEYMSTAAALEEALSDDLSLDASGEQASDASETYPTPASEQAGSETSTSAY